ncbi:hypothetical protein CVIRNUC_010735 [Coccomyxa viridis]|uniref:Phosphoglycerate mutase n=1 Tax=Coccomyxa viridis TaxID=1274662 RepID=A0AAV1IMN9_9CHLO|nr:hypothetical protein CVIRNUC_010735 [Coccomyxa viridis]
MQPPPSKRPRLTVEDLDGQTVTLPRGLQAGAATPGSGSPDTAQHPCGVETGWRLQSVERVFGSQSLNTPVQPGNSRWNGTKVTSACEDDFTISYSQSYTRVGSQSQHRTPPQANTDASVQAKALSEGGAGAAALHGQPAGRHVMTPELVSDKHLIEEHRSGRDIVQDAEHAAPPQRLFPIFRPKSQWKVLHVIRHGESEYNAATSLGMDFSDPQIFNPKLTEKGRRQAISLRTKLEKLAKLDGAVWVTSPLTRAMETFLLSCPKRHLLASGPSQAADSARIKVAIRPELTEHLVTTGDIGMPRTWLTERFPELRAFMEGMAERWWFAPEHNDPMRQVFKKTEPKKSLQERVGLFRCWVQAQPEQVIVAFGHSSMIKELAGGKRLRNCELLTMQL